MPVASEDAAGSLTGDGPAARAEPRDGICKGCQATVRIAPEAIRDMLRAFLEAHPQETADTDTVTRRLSRCRECPAFRYGTTCMHCGCLVDIRTRLAKAACPHPAGPRW